MLAGDDEEDPAKVEQSWDEILRLDIHRTALNHS